MLQKQKGEALAAEAKAMREVAKELAELDGMNLSELRVRHLELFGEEAKSKNLPFLRKKLAFRIQERVEGGLSLWAQMRVVELGPEDLPKGRSRERKEKVQKIKKTSSLPVSKDRDSRLPEVGTVLMREHGGFAHEVEVLGSGFSYRGRTYQSLSTLAKEITGTAWNGFLFFGLISRKKATDGC